MRGVHRVLLVLGEVATRLMISKAKKKTWGGYAYKGEKPDPKREKPTPAKGKRKNTKRWCRGKRGQEHDTHVVQHEWAGRVFDCGWNWTWEKEVPPGRTTPICFEREVCKNCGKILRHWLGKDCKLLKESE